MLLEASDAAQAKLLLGRKKVTLWHSYIRDRAKSEPRDSLILVPCAKAKPYTRPTKSFFYNWLWKFLEKENLRDQVFVCTVSEPFALFPENDYDKMPNYELSPLVLKREPELLEKYCSTLAKPIAGFLMRNHDKHRRVIAYVRPDSTHAVFLQRAMSLCGSPLVRFAVTVDDLRQIRKAHPRMWHLNWMIYLQNHLKRLLVDDEN